MEKKEKIEWLQCLSALVARCGAWKLRKRGKKGAMGEYGTQKKVLVGGGSRVDWPRLEDGGRQWLGGRGVG